MRTCTIALWVVLFVGLIPVQADPGGPLRLSASAMAEFERQRLRVPLVRIFDAEGRQVLEVRGWGEGMRPLDGLAAREPVPGRPVLSERLAEIEGVRAAATIDSPDYTALLYYADWCVVCRRMEPEFAAQVAGLAPLRFDVLHIEADPLRPR